jgi:hypothetical protein
MEKAKSKKNKGKNRYSKRRNDTLGSIPKAPMYRPGIRMTKRFRFTPTAAVGGPTAGVKVTTVSALGFLQVAKTTTTSQQIISAARLVSVEAWSNTVSGLNVQVALQWGASAGLGFVGSSQSIIEDTATNIVPAHIKCAPEHGSFAAQWFDFETAGTTTALFQIYATPQFATWDITLEFILDQGGQTSTGDGSSGLVPGSMYYGYADGRVSGVLAPAGAVNIIT